MEVLKELIQILCLVLLINKSMANIDTKENFCGKRLIRALAELCTIYNSPIFAQNRVKRQIVQECCETPCSRRYLLHNYCYEVNSSIKKELSLNSTEVNQSLLYQAEVTPKATEKNKETNNNNEQNIISKSDYGLMNSSGNNHHIRKSRGKRNCKCRKHKTKEI